jgi:hypothetical protein
VPQPVRQQRPAKLESFNANYSCSPGALP